MGALIYRESQLRKAEAATEIKDISSASTHRRTSMRKRLPINMLPCPQRKNIANRKRDSSLDEDSTRKKVPKKKYRYECSTDGCSNIVVRGGLCTKHGAKRKRCSSEGCTKYAWTGGVCVRHGAKVKLCSSEGCTNYAQKGGLCIRHGAKVEVNRCSSAGCINRAYKGGVCITHGAKRKLCSSEGCTNQAKPSEEECAKGMGPRSNTNDAALKDAQIKL